MQKFDHTNVNLPFLSYFRVRYADTDKMGIVYYGRYFEILEVGRTEWIRHYWKPYSEIERDGYLLPVVFSSCVYNKSFSYDDLIKIQCFPVGFTSTRIRFGYHLSEIQTDDTNAIGVTEHAFINQQGKIQRIPNELSSILYDRVSNKLNKLQNIFNERNV